AGILCEFRDRRCADWILPDGRHSQSIGSCSREFSDERELAGIYNSLPSGYQLPECEWVAGRNLDGRSREPRPGKSDESSRQDLDPFNIAIARARRNHWLVNMSTLFVSPCLHDRFYGGVQKSAQLAFDAFRSGGRTPRMLCYSRSCDRSICV